MKNSLLRPIYFVGKIGCHLSGHRFITTRNVTDHFKEFKCIQCGLELTNDETGKKISLTPEHRDINETLNQFYQKRQHLM
jgi:hypothetical protein